MNPNVRSDTLNLEIKKMPDCQCPSMQGSRHVISIVTSTAQPKLKWELPAAVDIEVKLPESASSSLFPLLHLKLLAFFSACSQSTHNLDKMALPRSTSLRGPSQGLRRHALRRTINQARSSPFRNAGRRSYASGHGHEAKKSSDLPWWVFYSTEPAL
jgi:hypothetical protein